MTNTDIERLTIAEVVAKTKASESIIRRAIAAEEMRSERLGRKILIAPAWVRDWQDQLPKFGPAETTDQ